MTTAPYPPTPQRYDHDDANPWVARLALLLIGGVMLFLIAVLALGAAFRTAYADRFAPGVSVYGVSVDGMTYDQAREIVAAQFTFDDTAVFTFRYGDQFWQYTAGELGVSFDVDATLAQAWSIGRDGNAVGGAVQQGLTWLNGESVAPVITYDQTQAVAAITTIAADIDQPASDGSLVMNGTSVTASPAQVGRTVDVQATLDRLDTLLTQLTTGGEIPLVVVESLPDVQGAELVAAQIDAALSAPLTLVTTASDGTALGPWTITPEQIAALLSVDLVTEDDGIQRYAVTVDFSAFEGYITEQLAPGLVTAPIDARYSFNEVTRELEVIQPAIGGRTVNVAATLAALEEKALSRTDRTVQVVYDYAQPRYHNNVAAADLGIRELVGESTTYYTGSTANRRLNISVAASRFNGVVIAPGEEFSFNYWLGEITEEAGFVEGKVIFGGRTINGLGGGVCQVSTTAFRAAFFGGFTIIERNSHGYRVGYYELDNFPPGLDAAIWTPERDFRFQNDTPHHLLIETSVFPATDALQFRFYSTNTGRQVEVEQARVANLVPAKPTIYEVNGDLSQGQALQVDYAAEGADVNVTRTITYPDGTVKEDNLFTHYLPWAAIIQVPPGDPRLATGG